MDSEAPQLLYMPPWLNGQSKLQSFERIARKARVSLGTSLPGSSRKVGAGPFDVGSYISAVALRVREGS